MATDSSTDQAPKLAEDPAVLSRILDITRRTELTSRGDLARHTGYTRAVISQVVDGLLGRGILTEIGVGESSGGRKPRMLRFRPGAGVIGAVDLGATSLDVAVTDLQGTVLSHQGEQATVNAGPQVVLKRTIELLANLLTAKGYRTDALWGIGMGVPGPVDYGAGMPVSPPIMPGWDRFPIRETLSAEFGCPVYVDNDANVLAVGEMAAGIGRGRENVIYVKVGTGIGAGIIVHGQVYRGSRGCAGEIGHLQVTDPIVANVICRCGNPDCLEALAGGGALAGLAEAAARGGQSPMLLARLNERGALSAADVAEMAAQGDSWAIERIRVSGHLIGYALAGVVNFFNPDLIIVGGGVSNAGDSFLAAIREMVYRRSLPPATRSLRIEHASLGAFGGVIGATHLVLDELFSAQNVAAVLARHTACAES